MKYLLKNIKEDLEYFLRKNVGREPLIITSYVYINTSTNTDETSQEYQLVGMTIDAQGEDTPKSS